MKLKFFADHCISNFIIKTLQDAGNEVSRLRDYLCSYPSMNHYKRGHNYGTNNKFRN